GGGAGPRRPSAARTTARGHRTPPRADTRRRADAVTRRSRRPATGDGDGMSQVHGALIANEIRETLWGGLRAVKRAASRARQSRAERAPRHRAGASAAAI